jgi:hypothetical protein
VVVIIFVLMTQLVQTLVHRPALSAASSAAKSVAYVVKGSFARLGVALPILPAPALVLRANAISRMAVAMLVLAVSMKAVIPKISVLTIVHVRTLVLPLAPCVVTFAVKRAACARPTRTVS